MKLLYPVALIALFFTACSRPKPIEKTEALQFAKQLERYVQQRRADSFNQAIDMDYILEAAGLSNLNSSEVRSSANLGGELFRSLEGGGSYQLIRYYQVKDTSHLVFRLVGEEGLNYHDVWLGRKQGKCVIRDLYTYTAGSYISETMKDVMNGFKKDGLAQDKEAAVEFSRIRTLMNARRYKEAEQAIDRLPYHLRNSKTVRLTAISNAQNLDEQTYLAAIEAFRQLYPEKGLYDLVLLDGYILNKQYDLALQAINNVDSSVGGDPALNYYRALMYYRKGDTASYARLLEKACTQVPDLQPAVLELIAHYLSEGNQAAADRYIANYRSHKRFDQARLQQVIANLR